MGEIRHLMDLIRIIHFATVWAAIVVSSMFRINILHRTWIELLMGFLFGLAEAEAHEIKESIRFFLPAEMCMCLYCPIFILKLMYGMDSFVFLKSAMQITLITLTGFIGVVGSIGFSIAYVERMEVEIIVVVVVGLCFSIYDPPFLNEYLDGVKNLAIICEGEAVFNMAISAMTLEVMIGVWDGYVNTWYRICFVYLRHISVSVVIGVIFGNILPLLCKVIIDDSISAVIIYVSSSYIIFIICKYMFYCDGVIATVIFIYYISKNAPRVGIEDDTETIAFIHQLHDIIHAIMIITATAYITHFIVLWLSISHILVSICAYAIGRILRMFHIMLLSPLLSRMAYGFDFFSFISMICATRNGLGSLLMVMQFREAGVLHYYKIRLPAIVFIYTFLTYLINGTIIRYAMKKYKLFELSNSRKINISAGMSIIIDKQEKMISGLKMNRFFSVANWPLINECTKLVNPFNIQMDINEGQSFGIRQMTCTGCLKKIFVEPTKKELSEISKDARYRVLKAVKLALVKQFDHGILGVKEIELLTQLVEAALDTDDLIIKLDEIYKHFKIPKMIEKTKIILIKMQALDILMKPEKPCRALCFKLFTNVYFKLFFHLIIALQVITAIVSITTNIEEQRILILIFNTAIDALCVIEIIIKIYGYSTFTIKDGCKRYIKNNWNKIDVLTLAINMCDTVFAVLTEVIEIPKSILIIRQIPRLTRIIRVLKLLEFFSNVHPRFLEFCDKKIEAKVAYAFTLGVAIIMAYEDVVEQLDSMIEIPFIRESIKTKLESDKTHMVEHIGTIVRKKPWVAITVETRQAVRGVLKHMKLGINELKSAGHVDEYEYEKLKWAIENHYKSLTIANYNQLIPPNQVFGEITYLCGDPATIEFLYDKVTTKIWNAGDIVCDVGCIIEGVLILIAGMFKITYIPNTKALQWLTKDGLLPIKDFLVNTRFTEEQTEFVVPGNTVGELSVLTGRGYSCQIVSYTSSQAFIIPRQHVWEAIETSMDPVNGLAPRMWKYITQCFVKRILLNTPIYHSMSDDNVNYILDRAIVPELGAFKSMVLCDLIEDVVLIEGLLIDSNTRCIYRAPCYLPKTVQNILLPKYSGLVFSSPIQTRLMIIPLVNADEYELVLRMEQISDMVEHAPSRLLLTNNRVIQQRRKKRINIVSRTKSSLSSLSARVSQTVMSQEIK